MTAPTDAELEKLRRAYSQWEDVQSIFTALDAARLERDEAIREWNRIAEGAQDLHEDYVTACSDRDTARLERDEARDYVETHRPRHHAIEMERDALAARVEALTAALLRLANAADDVGVRFFDTEWLEPEVLEMQNATEVARKALSSPEPAQGEGPSP